MTHDPRKDPRHRINYRCRWHIPTVVIFLCLNLSTTINRPMCSFLRSKVRSRAPVLARRHPVEFYCSKNKPSNGNLNRVINTHTQQLMTVEVVINTD